MKLFRRRPRDRGPGHGKGGPAIILYAVERTVAERTARVEARYLLDDDEEGGPNFEGVADLANRRTRGATKFSMPSVVYGDESELDGLGRLHLAGERIRSGWELIVRWGVGRVLKRLVEQEELYSDGRQYQRVEKGTRWTTFDSGPAGLRGDQDPLWLLDALEGVVEAHPVAQDRVRGSAAWRYQVILDLGLADARLGGGLCVPGPLLYATTQALPAEVWIDEQGRIRRMTRRPAVDHTVESGYETELFDFGDPAPIDSPSADALVEPGDVESWS